MNESTPALAPTSPELHGPLPETLRRPPVTCPPRQERGALIGRILRTLMLLLLLGGVITVFAVLALGVQVPGLSAAPAEKTVPAPPALGVKLVEGRPHTLAVPEDVRTSLGIRVGQHENIARVDRPKEGRPLVLAGSTALDPTLVKRIRARFAPAEVVNIGTMTDANLSGKAGRSVKRELRSGDWVQPDTVLGVFYSVDVGNKKNDLFDALLQLDLDKTILALAEKSPDAVPKVFLLNALRSVRGDRNAINRAENTLRAWGVPEEDIQDVHREAQAAIAAQDRAGHKDDKTADKQKVTREQLERWARVTLKAHESGVIMERNVSKNEMVVDNTVNLFQIAKVDQLMVVANVPEDELPRLLKLHADASRRGEPLPWVVRTLGAADKDGIEGWVNDVSYQIDLNQHSALVKGYIDNPRDQPQGGPGQGQPRLRSGQFVTVTINMPAPDDVVEVPVNAVVDDGRECVVFVETDARKHYYTLRRVEVTARYENVLLVRSTPFARGEELTKEEREQGLAPREPLLPGERVLTSGVLELKKELEDREAK